MADRRRPAPAATLAFAATVGATALAEATPARAEDFVCRGRDPAWELSGRAGGASAIFQQERGARRSLAGGAASNLSAEGVVVWRGRSGDGQADVVAVMLRGACTDPGAGEVSGYLGIVSVPGAGPSVGCCSYGGRVPATASAPGLPAAAPPGSAVAATVPLAAAAAAAGAAASRAAPAPAAPPPGLAPGSVARVAGSRRANLRAGPDEGARVVGKVAGGRSVVVREAARRDGQAWYRVGGRGLPSAAWIRGDLLLAAPAGDGGRNDQDGEEGKRDARPAKASRARGRPAARARGG